MNKQEKWYEKVTMKIIKNYILHTEKNIANEKVINDIKISTDNWTLETTQITNDARHKSDEH